MTVKVFFASWRWLLDVEVNPQTERTLSLLYRENGIYSCSRRSWERILLPHAK